MEQPIKRRSICDPSTWTTKIVRISSTNSGHSKIVKQFRPASSHNSLQKGKANDRSSSLNQLGPALSDTLGGGCQTDVENSKPAQQCGSTPSQSVTSNIIGKTTAILQKHKCTEESTDDESDTSEYEEFADIMAKVQDKITLQQEDDRGNMEENKRKSDKELWIKAKSRTISDIVAESCNSNCHCGGNCMFKFNAYDIQTLQTKFWGSKPPSTSQRRDLSEKLHKTYKARVDDNKNLSFCVPSFDGKHETHHRICEASFLHILGLNATLNASSASTQWKSIVRELYDPDVGEANQLEDDFDDYHRVGKKTQHAMKFIKILARFYGDYFASEQGSDKEGRKLDKVIIPHYSYSTIHEEYLVYCEIKGTKTKNIAKEGCFRAAFQAMEEAGKVRRIRCRGNFPPCSVCEKCNDVLRNKSRKYTRDQKIITLFFRRLHLQQQAREREALDERREAAETQFEENGNPKYGFIFGDAMTASKGDTMKDGLGQPDSNESTIANRIFAFEIASGPVHFMMYTSVDQLAEKGANLGVELQRLAINTMACELAKHGFDLPKTLLWQFDNSGENKNKEMIAFGHLLVDLKIVNEVQINFLVVGHTHCNIDQNFSVLTNAISAAKFVGSPMGMIALIGKAHHDLTDRPLYNIKVDFIHDWIGFFEPYIKDGQHMYYGVPHRFRIVRRFDRAILQYMLFSPPKREQENSLWLPKESLNIHSFYDSSYSEDQANQKALLDQQPILSEFPIGPFATVQDESTLLNNIGVSKSATEMASSSKDREIFSSYIRVREDILEMEELIVFDSRRCGDLEANGDSYIAHNDWAKTYADLKRKGTLLNNSNTAKAGYILFLDFDHASSKGALPTDLTVRPRLLPCVDEAQELIRLSRGRNRSKKEKRIIAINEKYVAGATRIASACTKAVKLIADGALPLVEDILDADGKVDYHATHDNFALRQISKSEHEWFKERLTRNAVIDMMMLERDRICKEEEFSIVQLPPPDQEKKQERLTRLAKSIATAADHGAVALASITRKREYAHLDAEILKRPKGPVNSLTNTTAPAVCEVVGCTNRWSIRCPLFTCARYICKEHKPEKHEEHEWCSFIDRQVEEASILKPKLDALKAKADAKTKAVIRCDCGVTIQKRGMKSHVKSAGHKAWEAGGQIVPAMSEAVAVPAVTNDIGASSNSEEDDDDADDDA